MSGQQAGQGGGGSLSAAEEGDGEKPSSRGKAGVGRWGRKQVSGVLKAGVYPGGQTGGGGEEARRLDGVCGGLFNEWLLHHRIAIRAEGEMRGERRGDSVVVGGGGWTRRSWSAKQMRLSGGLTLGRVSGREAAGITYIRPETWEPGGPVYGTGGACRLRGLEGRWTADVWTCQTGDASTSGLFLNSFPTRSAGSWCDTRCPRGTSPRVLSGKLGTGNLFG